MSENEKDSGQISTLQVELIENQESLQNLIFQKSMQQLEDLSQIKKTRRKIARIKTLLTQAKAS